MRAPLHNKQARTDVHLAHTTSKHACVYSCHTQQAHVSDTFFPQAHVSECPLSAAWDLSQSRREEKKKVDPCTPVLRVPAGSAAAAALSCWTAEVVWSSISRSMPHSTGVAVTAVAGATQCGCMRTRQACTSGMHVPACVFVHTRTCVLAHKHMNSV